MLENEAPNESRFIKSADEIFPDVAPVREGGEGVQSSPPELSRLVAEWVRVKMELVQAVEALGQLNRMATGFQTDRIIMNVEELFALGSVREDSVAEINSQHIAIGDLVERRDELEEKIMAVLPPGVWFAHENLLVGRSRGLTAVEKNNPNFM